jgi:hypothetical protein
MARAFELESAIEHLRANPAQRALAPTIATLARELDRLSRHLPEEDEKGRPITPGGSSAERAAGDAGSGPAAEQAHETFRREMKDGPVTDERRCAVCNADLADRRPDAKTCSAGCRRELSRRRERDAPPTRTRRALEMTARLAAASESTVDRDAQTGAEHPEASDVGALTKALGVACARPLRALRPR